MIIVYSKNDIPIRLNQERWAHIINRHPEMIEQKENVLTTITDPDLIQQGDFDELLAVRFFPMTPLTKKYLIVVYKEIDKYDGYILTSYFSSDISKRRLVLWKH